MDRWSARYLLPLPEGLPRDPEDFRDWALQASTVDGVRYGIPCHACVNVFLYRADDHALDEALDQARAGTLTLDELGRIIGTHADPKRVQPRGPKGLLFDLTGRTTVAGLFMESWMDTHGAHDPYPPLPESPFDPTTLANLGKLVAMTGPKQAAHTDKDSERRTWFLRGRGRALVTFTEVLATVPDPSLLKLCPLPLSDTVPSHFVYVNLAAINSAISPEKREHALRLLDLMTGTRVMCDSLRSEELGGNSQFIIPVRRGVLNDLADKTPGYRVIGDLIADDAERPCRPFQFGPMAGQRAVRGVGKEIRHKLLPPLLMPGSKGGAEPSFDDREPSEEEKSLPANLFRRD